MRRRGPVLEVAGRAITTLRQGTMKSRFRRGARNCCVAGRSQDLEGGGRDGDLWKSFYSSCALTTDGVEWDLEGRKRMSGQGAPAGCPHGVTGLLV